MMWVTLSPREQSWDKKPTGTNGMGEGVVRSVGSRTSVFLTPHFQLRPHIKTSNPSSNLPCNHRLPSHHAEILTLSKSYFFPQKAAISPGGSGDNVQRGGSCRACGRPGSQRFPLPERQQKRLDLTCPLAAGAGGDKEMVQGGDRTRLCPHQGPCPPMTFTT